MRLGMRTLSKYALWVCVALSVIVLFVCLAAGGRLPLTAFMVYMFVNFFCNGILFGNFNALAMEPMGNVAGMASSISGTVTTCLSVLLGGIVGQMYDGTLIPVIGGFAGLGLGALIFTEWAERVGRGSRRSAG
jgi:DHA1 family bicyclomycin/chloramphenicol resistance-like MFS transporter